MEQVITRLKRVSTVAYSHKFKLGFLILALYLAKKGYDLYKFLKPLLAMKNDLMGMGGSSSNQQQLVEQTESQKKLDALL